MKLLNALFTCFLVCTSSLFSMHWNKNREIPTEESKFYGKFCYLVDVPQYDIENTENRSHSNQRTIGYKRKTSDCTMPSNATNITKHSETIDLTAESPRKCLRGSGITRQELLTLSNLKFKKLIEPVDQSDSYQVKGQKESCELIIEDLVKQEEKKAQNGRLLLQALDALDRIEKEDQAEKENIASLLAHDEPRLVDANDNNNEHKALQEVPYSFRNT